LKAAAKASTQVQKSAAAADDEDMDPTVFILVLSCLHLMSTKNRSFVKVWFLSLVFCFDLC